MYLRSLYHHNSRRSKYVHNLPEHLSTLLSVQDALLMLLVTLLVAQLANWGRFLLVGLHRDLVHIVKNYQQLQDETVTIGV